MIDNVQKAVRLINKEVARLESDKEWIAGGQKRLAKESEQCGLRIVILNEILFPLLSALAEEGIPLKPLREEEKQS